MIFSLFAYHGYIISIWRFQKMISSFRGKYNFLSNFFAAPVTYDGHLFGSNEAAFQAAKCPRRACEFCNLGPAAAKKLGRRVELRPEWEYVKDRVMFEIVLNKFTQNPALKELLLETGDEELVEGNTWGDRYWGVCNGSGQNKLGKILMKVRELLRENS